MWSNQWFCFKVLLSNFQYLIKSPLKTPTELISQYPKISIFVCEYDPLHDDSIRFYNKLLKNKVSAELLVFKNLPHGLLNFDIPNGLPEASLFVEKTIRYLEIFFEERE